MMTSFGPYGDLGRADFLTRPEDVPGKAIRAAQFLKAVADVALNQGFDEERGLSYGIEFPVRTITDMALQQAEAKFPPGVTFYSAGGQRIFDIRGAGGGVTTSQICYVICIPKEE